MRPSPAGMNLRDVPARIREFVIHDSTVAREVAARVLYGSARLARALGRRDPAYSLLMRTHRAGLSPAIEQRIANEIRVATLQEHHGHETGLWTTYDRLIAGEAAAFRTSPYKTPDNLLGGRVLVVKSPRPGERGVLVVDYSKFFALFAAFFDVDAIVERYFIVLEPSAAGACSPEILAYTRFRAPVFVEAPEPRDQTMLAALETNLQSLPFGANWWVDYRRMTPLPRSERDIDVIMIASWSAVKRHALVFRALAKLRRRGRKLSVVLIGVPWGMSQADIERLAEQYGIRDQIRLFEYIKAEQVSRLLVRSKVCVLWSRRECANRSIIEAMVAGVPVLVRKGLSYGYQYPYINEDTGQFVEEAELAEAIITTIDGWGQRDPRRWVLEHMTPAHATRILNDQIRATACARGERWTEDAVAKTYDSNFQQYWDEGERARFAADYDFLRSTRRNGLATNGGNS